MSTLEVKIDAERPFARALGRLRGALARVSSKKRDVDDEIDLRAEYPETRLVVTGICRTKVRRSIEIDDVGVRYLGACGLDVFVNVLRAVGRAHRYWPAGFTPAGPVLEVTAGGRPVEEGAAMGVPHEEDAWPERVRLYDLRKREFAETLGHDADWIYVWLPTQHVLRLVPLVPSHLRGVQRRT